MYPMRSGMTERNFGAAGDRGSYCRRFPWACGRTLAVPMYSRPAAQSFGERSIGV